MTQQQLIEQSDDLLDRVIAAWLHAKYQRTQSERTVATYGGRLAEFRRLLVAAGLDLDGPADQITLALQGWAGHGEPAPSTFNLRVAAVSSFYDYARKHGASAGPNPADLVDRSIVQQYARAVALEPTVARDALARINRSTLQGLRDYALLSVGLYTGRRLAELGGLRWRDVQVLGDDGVILTFVRCKGNKTMRDRLKTRVARAFLAYARAMQQHHPCGASDPVWVNLSPAYAGRELGRKGIALLCERYLGTTKTHTIRHTFAFMMERGGARLTEIQGRLGHSNSATTGIYVQALTSDDNRLGEQLADFLNI